MLFRTRRVHRRGLLTLALCVTAVALIPSAAQASGSNASLPKVMTRNLYLGADLNPGIAALTCTPQPFCLLAANQGIWNAVVATDFPARAKKLAKEIDDDDPYIVGLQEVALWRSGPIDGVKNATTVEYDFLATLLAELQARGNKYTAFVTQQEADIESPSASPPTFSDGRDRRLTMRDVILTRTDLPKVLVSFSGAQSGNYDPTRVIQLQIGASAYGDPCVGLPGNCIIFKRGWTALDIKILGHPVARFVNTHLESAASGIRQAQAAELVGAFGTGPLLNPNLPAILVGDFNSDAAITPCLIPDPQNPPPCAFTGQSDGAALGIVTSAGFVDSGNTQNTFGHDANLLDFPSNPFTERIDHVVTRPTSYGLLTSKVVGNDPANRAPSGAGLLWPSDHGGLIVGIG